MLGGTLTASQYLIAPFNSALFYQGVPSSSQLTVLLQLSNGSSIDMTNNRCTVYRLDKGAAFATLSSATAGLLVAQAPRDKAEAMSQAAVVGLFMMGVVPRV